MSGHAKQKLSLGGFQNALLHLAELDFEHLLELFAAQRMKHHHFVQAVHEFRREFAARGFDGRAFHFLVQGIGAGLSLG